MTTKDRMNRLFRHYGCDRFPAFTHQRELDFLDKVAAIDTRGEPKAGPYWVGSINSNYVGTRIRMHEDLAFGKLANNAQYFHLGREADELPSIYGRMRHG